MGPIRMQRILSRMEPGVEYTAKELAYITKESACAISGVMKILADEGYVVSIPTTAPGHHGRYCRNTYMIKEDENGC